VRAAQAAGYRSRAAYKLIGLDDRFHLLKKGLRVVDLGAAPGGWSQVAAERTAAGKPGGGRIVAVDRAALDPIAGVEALCADVHEPALAESVLARLGEPADLVLSDMAPPATGHAATDHLRIVALAERALDIAQAVLKPGGAFVVKVYQGGAEPTLFAAVKRAFLKVRRAKPLASRAESAETYIVATGYHGRREP
jgi:23S rRNA (uridine2552-2'-O)-methyltransferase